MSVGIPELLAPHWLAQNIGPHLKSSLQNMSAQLYTLTTIRTESLSVFFSGRVRRWTSRRAPSRPCPTPALKCGSKSCACSRNQSGSRPRYWLDRGSVPRPRATLRPIWCKFLAVNDEYTGTTLRPFPVWAGEESRRWGPSQSRFFFNSWRGTL